MHQEQPSIYPFGIRIDTPVTALTDLFVTAVCVYAFIRLRQMPGNHKIKRYLEVYFISMGIATAVGGLLGHAFLYAFSFTWKLPGWFTSMVSVAVLERACIMLARRFLRPGLVRVFIWLNVAELLTFMFISFYTLNFIYVEVHTAYGLGVVVFSLSVYLYRQTKHEGNKLFIIAVVVSAFAGISFIGKIGLGLWFNHYDVSHIFMTIGAWIFYLGSKKIITNLGPGKLYDC